MSIACGNVIEPPPPPVKKPFLSLLIVAGLQCLTGLATTAHATTYAGNGNTGFNGAVGSGTLSVTNNASGGFVFAFTLGGGQTNLGGNDLEIYIDNGKGGGIGTSTASLTDTADGGRQAVSEYSGTNRSTLSFGTLLSPQFALDLSINNANVFELVNNGSFAFNGGQTIGNAGQGGVTFTVATVGANTVLTETFPATDLGLTANSGATLKFVAIQVSETGYSSNEATVALTGNLGYGNTQTISNANSFASAVPEPGTWAMLASGIGILVTVQRFRRRSAA